MNVYLSIFFDWSFVMYFAAGVCAVAHFVSQRPGMRTLAFGSASIAWCLITAILAARTVAAGALAVFGLHGSFLFFIWVIGALYLFVEYKARSSVNGIFVLPLVTLMLGVTKFIDSASRPLPPALQSPWLGIHVLTCFLGYACFVMGFCFAILYLWQEAEVKSRRVDRFFFRLPSLGLLDALGYRTIASGFIFLTLGIISGSLWAQTAWGAFWNWDPKETSSLVLWLVYVVYLHGRATRGWKGRRSAYLAICGFVFMIFTYLGVSFLLPGMHAYL